MTHTQEIRRLNAIRGLAVLIVLVSHYSNVSGIFGAMFGGSGHFGVMLFFLLSAFLMTHLYYDFTPTREKLRAFAVARIARVIPLFLFLVLLSFALTNLAPKEVSKIFYDIPDAAELLSHLLLLSGTSVLWTIPPEIHFYVVFALLWWAKPVLGRLIILILLVLTALFFLTSISKGFRMYFSLPGIGDIYFSLALLKVYPYFCMGMLFGLLHRQWSAPERWRSGLFLLTLAVIPFLYPKVFTHFTGATLTGWEDPLIFVVVCTLFFALVFLVPDHNVVLENRVGDFLGKVSYSVYLLHYPVLLFVKQLGLAHGISGAVIFLALTLLVSELSFRFLEAPARTWFRSKFHK